MLQPKPIRFTAHAETVIQARAIERAWVTNVLRSPTWREADRYDPSLERAFAPVAERQGRYLRVVYGETGTEFVTITAFFDRNARLPQGAGQ